MWLFNFIADEFLVVSLPRFLVLRNQRLGIFYKVLQVVALTSAALYSVYSGVFFQHSPVKAWGVNVWHVPSAATGVQAGPECENPEVYTYKGDPMLSYTPTSCKAVTNDEPNQHGDKLFLPTFFDEETVWDRCGANVSEICRGYSSKVIYTQANGSCACTLKEQFLVQNADGQHIRFVYGYEADPSDGKLSDLRHGGIVSSMVSKEESHQMKGQKSNLVTQFLSPDGSECSFGGRSMWQHSDAAGGITGTLNELLACAGVTLDSDPETLVAGTFAAPPHLRTMGFKLQMHLLILEDALFNIKCEVRVKAIPVTTARWDDNARPSVIPGIGASTRRTQRVHGVLIDVHMMGSIKTFNWSQLVRGFVDIAVVLTLPSMIVQFVAMYLLGLVSEVYRHTVRTKLNILGKFHNTIAKLMLAEVAYRGLVGKWDGHITDLGSLSPRMLLHRLEDIFAESRNTGELEKEELAKMAGVVFTSIDEDGNGEIGCSEFIQACTNDGDISLHQMAKFFNKKTPKQFMRRLFDDTEEMADDAAKRAPSSLVSATQSLEQAVKDLDRKIAKKAPRIFGRDTQSRGQAVIDLDLVDTDSPDAAGTAGAASAAGGPGGAGTTGSAGGAGLLLSIVNAEISRVGSEETKDVPPSVLGREETKDVPPSILASHNILAAHACTLVRLEKRMQELELNCEQALDMRRVFVESPHSMAAAMTTETAAMSAMKRDTKVSSETADVEARFCKLDDALAELQKACELQAALALSNSDKIRTEAEDLRWRFDAASHELRLRCQILERHYRGLAHSSSWSQAVQESPHGVSSRQKMQQCLRDSLSPVCGAWPEGGGLQLQRPPHSSVEEVTSSRTERKGDGSARGPVSTLNDSMRSVPTCGAEEECSPDSPVSHPRDRMMRDNKGPKGSLTVVQYM